MVKNHTTKTQKTTVNNPVQPTALDRVTLAFEYDKTLREIKHNVRLRTM